MIGKRAIQVRALVALLIAAFGLARADARSDDLSKIAGREVASKVSVHLASKSFDPYSSKISLSPNGTKIAYTARPGQPYPGADWGIVVRNIEGTWSKPLATGGFMYPLICSWSPDSKYVFVTAAWLNTPSQGPKAGYKNGRYILRIGVHSDSLSTIRMVESGCDCVYPSPDGKKVLLVAKGIGRKDQPGSSDPWISSVVNGGKGKLRRLQRGMLPRWSPDGRRIAFLRLARGIGPELVGQQDLWTAGGNGRGARRVLSMQRVLNRTGTTRSAIMPEYCWLSDSRTLLVSVWRESKKSGGGYDIYVVDAGGEIKEIIKNTRLQDCTADGRKLLIRFGAGNLSEFQLVTLKE